MAPDRSTKVKGIRLPRGSKRRTRRSEPHSTNKELGIVHLPADDRPVLQLRTMKYTTILPTSGSRLAHFPTISNHDYDSITALASHFLSAKHEVSGPRVHRANPVAASKPLGLVNADHHLPTSNSTSVQHHHHQYITQYAQLGRR